MDKLANIEALVAVVEAGGFTKAAERLNIAKSVVSRRVRALEAELGVQLLQRTTRTQSLTGPGRQYYERAVHILADLEEAEQSIIDASADLRGSLKLAAPLSFGLHHLTLALSTFMQEHPGIELELDLNDREINLVEEGFDMAVRVGHLRDSTLLARRLGSARLVTCASPDYLMRYGTPEHPSELEKHIGLHYANANPQTGLAVRYRRAGATDRDSAHPHAGQQRRRPGSRRGGRPWHHQYAYVHRGRSDGRREAGLAPGRIQTPGTGHLCGLSARPPDAQTRAGPHRLSRTTFRRSSLLGQGNR